MSCSILIDCGLFEKRIAVIQDDKLTDFIIEHEETKSVLENIYLGRISGFSDTMDGAFVDLGGKVSGLLLSRNIPASGLADAPARQKLHDGEKCIVQVIKDAKDGKAAQLSAYIELGNPDLIYKPLSNGIVFAKKFKDKTAKQDIRGAFGTFDGGATVRSRAITKSTSSLKYYFEALQSDWKAIQNDVQTSQTPRLLRSALPLELKLATEHMVDTPAIVTNDPTRYKELTSTIKTEKLTHATCALWTKPDLLFDVYHIEQQIEDASSKRLPLPSGGNITIEETEALVVIDVNSGANDKSTGLQSVTFSTNAEGARLLAEQLRIRNLSGIIIIDFIQMSQKEEHRKIEAILRQETNNDPSAVRVIGMTELGLMQLTRQRKRPPLSAANNAAIMCGTDFVPRAAATQLMTDIQRYTNSNKTRQISLSVSPDLAPLLAHNQRSIENALSVNLKWEMNLALRGFEFNLSHP
ncbi:MAG: ribonuclease E/G [Sneathiella sp.]|nr:ribonuclease E/G [Sneathiella sp.]